MSRQDFRGVLAAPAEARGSNNFDLIRLLLASLVIVSHAGELASGDRRYEPLSVLGSKFSLGDVAVDGFFILSGYLITLSWMRDPKALPFLARRARRICPGFLAAAVLTGLLFPLAAEPARLHFAHFSWQVWFSSLPFLNVAYVSAYPGSHYGLANGSLWTIPFEVGCYLLTVALGLCGALRRPWVLVVLIGAAGIWCDHSLARFGSRLAAAGLGRLLIPYLCGALYAVTAKTLRPGWRLGVPALLLSLACLFKFRGAFLALPVPLTLAMFWLAYLKNPWREWTDRLPDVSYGVYLYGWPATKVIQTLAPGMGVPALTAVSWAAALGFGLLSYYLIERPWLSRRGVTFAWPAGLRYRDLIRPAATARPSR